MRWDDESFDELARDLRQGAGAEMRAEAEEVERQAHLGRLRTRSLADVARQAMHRGDRAVVEVAGRIITGHVSHTGTDYMVVEGDDEVVDIRLAQAAIGFERSAHGGHSTSAGSTTMRARLAEYEQTGEPVRLVAPLIPMEVAGSLIVVARDHVTVRRSDGGDVHLPIDAIALVIRPRPRR